MSRIANAPVQIPAGVEISLSDTEVTVKGSKGTLTRNIHPDVNVSQEDSALKFAANVNSQAAPVPYSITWLLVLQKAL